MKLSKEQKKLIAQKIKAEAKKEGYKVYNQYIWRKDGENLVRMLFLFSNLFQNKIDYDITIKKYVYDDIFGEIMNMSSNSRERESLRVNGALRCIAYIDTGEYECAKEFAKEAVRNGEDGGFENLGLSFFQWLLHYLRKRKVKNFFHNLRG